MRLRFPLLLVATALIAGCATPTTTPGLLEKARFRTMTAAKPQQMTLLKTLPAQKITAVVHHHRPYYVFPDMAQKRIYVGNPREYAAYQKSCVRLKIPPATLVQPPPASGKNPWDAWVGIGDGWSTF